MYSYVYIMWSTNFSEALRGKLGCLERGWSLVFEFPKVFILPIFKVLVYVFEQIKLSMLSSNCKCKSHQKYWTGRLITVASQRIYIAPMHFRPCPSSGGSPCEPIWHNAVVVDPVRVGLEIQIPVIDFVLGNLVCHGGLQIWPFLSGGHSYSSSSHLMDSRWSSLAP